MDFILSVAGGKHYFKVPAKTGLIFKATMTLVTVANHTDVQHRYVTVELTKKGSLTDV